MAITVIQSKSSATTSLTLNSATTAKNCLVVAVMSISSGGASSVSGMTIGGNASNFTQLVAAHGVSGSTFSDTYIWACPNCPGSATAISVTGSGLGAGGFVDIVALESSGIVLSSVLDKSSTGNGIGTSWTSNASGTTSQPQELVVGAVQPSLNTPGVPGSPWTNVSGSTFALGYQVATSTGTFTYSGTASSSGPWSAAVVTLFGVTSASVVTQEANPGITWKRNFNKTGKMPMPRPAYNIIPPVHQPQQPIQPGQTWNNHFGLPKHEKNYSSLASGIVLGLTAQASVKSAASISISSSETASSVSIAPHSGIEISAVLEPPSRIATTSYFGAITNKISLSSYSTVRASLGQSKISFPGSAANINEVAYFGHISQPNTIYGYVAKVFTEGISGSISVTKPVNAASVSQLSAIGVVSNKITNTTPGISISAYMTQPKISLSLLSSSYVDAEMGHINAGCTVDGLAATGSVSSNFGRLNISLSSSSNVIAATSQAHSVSVGIPSRNILVQPSPVKILVSASGTAHISSNSLMGTIRLSVSVIDAISSASARKGTIRISPVISASDTGISSSANIKVSITGQDASIGSSSSANTKIIKTCATVNIGVVALNEGTDVGPIVSSVMARAYPGQVTVFHSIPAAISVKAYPGTAGGFIIEGSMDDEDQWSGTLFNIYDED